MEIDYMTHLKHPNLIPCEASERVALRAGNQGAISEYLIIMPYYRVNHILTYNYNYAMFQPMTM